MKAVKLGLNLTTMNGQPLMVNGTDVVMSFGMRLVSVLPSNKSVFEFRFEGVPNIQPVVMEMDSDGASDFFSAFDDVIYAESPTASVTVAEVDANGNSSGSATIVLGIGQPVPGVRVLTVDVTTGGAPAVSFSLASTDTSAMFLFMDSMLWSNPPSPPH